MDYKSLSLSGDQSSYYWYSLAGKHFQGLQKKKVPLTYNESNAVTSDEQNVMPLNKMSLRFHRVLRQASGWPTVRFAQRKERETGGLNSSSYMYLSLFSLMAFSFPASCLWTLWSGRLARLSSKSSLSTIFHMQLSLISFKPHFLFLSQKNKFKTSIRFGLVTTLLFG